MTSRLDAAVIIIFIIAQSVMRDEDLAAGMGKV